MSEQNIKRRYQLLVLIATPKLCDKAATLFSNSAMPIQYRLSGEGTASSEIMDTLGFGGVDKGVLLSTVPEEFGREMLKLLHSKLGLDAVNSGISFTIPLTGASKLLADIMNSTVDNSKEIIQRKGENEMTGSENALVVAFVNRGFSGEVMDAAREAGAGGGTVLHSHSIGSKETAGFWGLGIQEEKDIVLIITDNERKKDIMTKIGEKCGINSKANGTVVSLPIDSVTGI